MGNPSDTSARSGRGRRPPCIALLALATALSVLGAGCDLMRGNPTPGAEAVDFGKGWLRHKKDSYDRDAYVVIGFTLIDRERKAIAADGKLEVELEWSAASHDWKLRGSTDVSASDFHAAAGKPVEDGTWYVEPWSAYMIGSGTPGASEDGYYATFTFTTAEGKRLQYYRWLTPEK